MSRTTVALATSSEKMKNSDDMDIEDSKNEGVVQGIDDRGPLPWEEFFRTIETFSEGWLFRGHRCASWELKTSLERHTPTDEKPSRAEERLLREFRSRADIYLNANQVPATTLEWLALMQHFGAPTRLLDMTKSPYVAAYFAVEDATPGENCAVWAVNESWCVEAAGKVIAVGKPEMAARFKDHFESGALPNDIDLELTLGYMWSWGLAKLDDDSWLEDNVAVVVPGHPDKLTERLSIQQGGFLIPRAVDQPFMENLNALGDAKGNVVKFTIESKDRPQALDQLRLMNVTRASLFPGLEGFAQSFRQSIVREPLEDKMKRIRTRLALDGLREAVRTDKQ